MSKVPVQQYIHDVELNKDPIENTITDIKNYITIHQQNMPKLLGLKSVALTGAVLREWDDQDEYAPPELGIPVNQLIDTDELSGPHYYAPNFVRPVPVPEPELEDFDELEPIWLLPGILPEPYWDMNMG